MAVDHSELKRDPGDMWPEDVRVRALSVYEQHGSKLAAEITGVPQSTIATWAAQAHLPATYPGAAGNGATTKRARWLDQQAAMADLFGELACQSAESALKLDAEGDYLNAQRATISGCAAADKAQLLSGAATGRQEALVAHLTPQERRQALEQVMRSRRDLVADAQPAALVGGSAEGDVDRPG